MASSLMAPPYRRLIRSSQPLLAIAPPNGRKIPASMQQRRPWLLEDDDEAADRQTASLAGVAITLLLLVIGLFLVHELHAKAMLEDCLMSGRGNCDQLVDGNL